MAWKSTDEKVTLNISSNGRPVIAPKSTTTVSVQRSLANRELLSHTAKPKGKLFMPTPGRGYSYTYDARVKPDVQIGIWNYVEDGVGKTCPYVRDVLVSRSTNLLTLSEFGCHPDALTDATVRNSVRRRARTSETEPFSLGVFCGEFAETAGMFVEFAKRVNHAYWTVHPSTPYYARKNHFSSLKKSLQRPIQPGAKKPENTYVAAKGYLTWNFGISPVLDDAQAISTHVSKGYRFREDTAVIFPFRRKSEVVRPFSVQDFPDGTITIKSDTKWRNHCQIVYKQGLAAELARWNALNPLAVGYQLLPLSFVLDWGINLGEYLQSLDSSVMIESLTWASRRIDVVDVEYLWKNKYSEFTSFSREKIWQRSSVAPLSLTAELEYKFSPAWFQLATGLALFRALAMNTEKARPGRPGPYEGYNTLPKGRVDALY